MKKIENIVVLTGAGISAESGLATFRAEDGLWCDHRIEDVATPEAFARDPALVHRFYNMRRAQLAEVQPNPAHHALARLASEWKGNFLLVTQNVDDLHDRALAIVKTQPGFRLLPMHGRLTQARCNSSGQVFDREGDLDETSACECCGGKGVLRPHIVWFGEMPVGMEIIDRALRQCDLFISIGTSGNVYPAAGFVQQMRAGGHGHTVELNLDRSLGHSFFHEKKYGPATELVPEYVRKILDGQVA